MALDLDKSIIIRGVKRKGGAVNIESRPGADAVNVSDYETDPGKILNISDYGGRPWYFDVPFPTPTLNLRSVAYSPKLNLIVAVSGSTVGRKVITSSDGGFTWEEQTAPDSFWTSVVWADGLNLFVAIASSGTSRVITSDDGTTWTTRSAPAVDPIALTWAAGLSLLVAVAPVGTNRVMTSPNGINWTVRTAAEQNQWIGVTWAAGLSLLVAVSADGTNRVMTSSDGTTWASQSAAEQNTWNSVTYAPELGTNGLLLAVSENGTNRVMTSPDGTTWTSRSITANSWINVIWISELSRFCTVAQNGGIALASCDLQAALNDVNGTTKTAVQIDLENLIIFPIANLTLSANSIVQGYPFTLSGYGFATVSTYNFTLQNCIAPYPFVVGNNIQATLDHCEFILSTGIPMDGGGLTKILGCRLETENNHALQIDNLGYEIKDSLLITRDPTKKAANLNGHAIAIAGVDIQQSTFYGDLSIDNPFGTGKERMRDNINYGNINVTTDFIIDSGDVFGSIIGATPNPSQVKNLNPLFAGTVDFRLQREIDGFNFDSPLVRASYYSVTSKGSPRDMGAWNIDDSEITDDYSLAAQIPKPLFYGGQNGGIMIGKSFSARDETGQSGEVDVYNNPERRKDIITINYQQIDIQYWTLIEKIFSNKNMEVQLIIEPQDFLDVSAIVTANGGESTGSPIINISTPLDIPSGGIITAGDKIYTVMYPVPLSGPTEVIVLDRVTETEITDSQQITVQFSFGAGVYKLLPHDLDFEYIDKVYVQGVVLKFLRKSL